MAASLTSYFNYPFFTWLNPLSFLDMGSVIIDVNNINLRDVSDEDRPSHKHVDLLLDGRNLEIRFKGVTGCKELGMGSNEVDLDRVKLALDKVPVRSFKKSIQKILRYVNFELFIPYSDPY